MQQQQEPGLQQQQHEQQSTAGSAAPLNTGRRPLRDKSHHAVGGMTATEVPNSERTRAARTAAAAAARVADAAAAAIRASAAAGNAQERAAGAVNPAAFLGRPPRIPAGASVEAQRVVAQADAIYAAAAELAAVAAEGLRKRPPFPPDVAASGDYSARPHRTGGAAPAAGDARACGANAGRQQAATAANAAAEETGSGWDTAGAVARLLLSLPVRGLQLLLHFIVGVFRRIASAFSLMSSALMLSPPPPFAEMYEKDYGEKHPVFFSGTLPEAIDAARREERLLVLYFHSMRSSSGDRFCTEVLTDDLVIELLDHSSIFYAVDASYSSEASRLLRTFFPTNPRLLPALAIVLPPPTSSSSSSGGWRHEGSRGTAAASSRTPPSSSSSSVSSSSSLEGRSRGTVGGGAAASRGGGGVRRYHQQHVHLRSRWLLRGLQAAAVGNVEELVAALVRAQEKNDEAKEQRARHLQEVETNRRLREEQEREFEEVVRQERLKAQQLEEQRAAAERRRRQREEELRQQEKRKEERKKAAEEIRQLLKEEDLVLSTERSAGQVDTEATLTVSLRLSSGARFCRRFRSTASLEDLYIWADCVGELSGKHEVVIPWRFDLVVPPKQILKRGPETLAAAGLYPSAALLLVPVEEDEKEE